MRLVALLLLTSAALGGAVPASFIKADNGWSKISSRELVQRIMKEVEWRPGSASWAGAERHGPVDSETDDEEEATAQEEWASGDDNPDRDVEGVCIHRDTLHSIERGSVEFHPTLCLLCACQPSGLLQCQKTC